MNYRLNLLTKRDDVFNIGISFTSTNAIQFTIQLSCLKDENGVNIFDFRRGGYPLVLISPFDLDATDLEKIHSEILKDVKGVFQHTPKQVDVISKSISNETFSTLFSQFGSNALCSSYPNNYIHNLTDFIETLPIKRLLGNDDSTILTLDPDQTVFRLSDIRNRNIFPNINLILRDGYIHVLENVLSHNQFEKTLYLINLDSYVSLSPHVGYIETPDSLCIWMVSAHILAGDISNRTNTFDPDIKHNVEINTTLLIDAFQRILEELKFISIAIIENRSIYSYENETIVFIGDFPGDIVTSKLKQNYLDCIKHYNR